MLKKMMFGFVLAGLIAIPLAVGQPMPSDEKAQFGGPEDLAFAKKLWKAIDGYPSWKLHSKVYKGASPHGKYVQLFSTWVKIEGKKYPLIIKDNFGGRGAKIKKIKADREEWLKAVTVMLQRENGYDSENDNWFWVKFSPKGEVMSNPKGMKLAGRVAKGMPKGCIACHSNAGGDDYLYSNDGE